ncbi:MAG: hypothetical protein ACRDGA_01940 [Bacteroidota bacterium]
MGSSTMLDFISSMIIFAVLMLTVGRVQVNLNSTLYYNTINYMTQNYALELSKIVEFDFHKMGYGVTGATAKIDTADTNRITFKYHLQNSATERQITYRLDAGDADSENPRDSVLYRIEKIGAASAVSVPYRMGVTAFRLRYYKSNFTELSTPVDATYRDSIHSIQVHFRVESPEPIIMPDVTQYISIFWEKLIYPRNISSIR